MIARLQAKTVKDIRDDASSGDEKLEKPERKMEKSKSTLSSPSNAAHHTVSSPIASSLKKRLTMPPVLSPTKSPRKNSNATAATANIIPPSVSHDMNMSTDSSHVIGDYKDCINVDSGIIILSSGCPAPYLAAYDPYDSGTNFACEINTGISSVAIERNLEENYANNTKTFKATPHMEPNFYYPENISNEEPTFVTTDASGYQKVYWTALSFNADSTVTVQFITRNSKSSLEDITRLSDEASRVDDSVVEYSAKLVVLKKAEELHGSSSVASAAASVMENK